MYGVRVKCFSPACFLLLCMTALGIAAPASGFAAEPPAVPDSYTDLGSGVIRDNISGLMWQQATAPGLYTWQEALEYCDNLVLGGHDDWRLPAIKELSSLVAGGFPTPNPAINTAYFPDTEASFYWSSTPFSNDPNAAWGVLFYGGGYFGSDKAVGFHVRAVRGLQYGLEGDVLVSISGPGSGTITSSDGRISCGTRCAAVYEELTTVTLTSEPDTGSTFAGWSGGGCLGAGDCTVTVKGMLKIQVDADGDGVENARDNCPRICNVFQTDADGDGIGDVCDSSPGCGGCGQVTCEQPGDADDDGIGDTLDNCPYVCNRQQLDADDDGQGDACDQTPGCGGCGMPACEEPCQL